jgi:hypothetical protein
MGQSRRSSSHGRLNEGQVMCWGQARGWEWSVGVSPLTSLRTELALLRSPSRLRKSQCLWRESQQAWSTRDTAQDERQAWVWGEVLICCGLGEVGLMDGPWVPGRPGTACPHQAAGAKFVSKAHHRRRHAALTTLTAIGRVIN